MAEKPTTNKTALYVALGAGVLLLAVVGWLLLGPKPPKPPGSETNELGPDTVQMQPTQTASPTQLAGLNPAPSDVPPAASPVSTASPDQVVAPAAAPRPPANTNPSSLDFTDDSLIFRAAFPGPAGDRLIDKLRADGTEFLGSVKPQARAAVAAQKRKGEEIRPWRVAITWRETARAGGLASFIGLASLDKAGAHPEPLLDSMIAREANGQELSFNAMLLPDKSPSPAFVIGVCDALKQAKQAKIKEATILGEPIICAGNQSNVNLEDAQVVLAPSDQPGRFGGAYVYFPPYAVGAYSEGMYRVAVSQAAFAHDLRAEFKPLFAGSPLPLKD